MRVGQSKYWVAWTHPLDGHREHADWSSEQSARIHVAVLREVGMKNISIEFGPSDAAVPVEVN